MSTIFKPGDVVLWFNSDYRNSNEGILNKYPSMKDIVITEDEYYRINGRKARPPYAFLSKTIEAFNNSTKKWEPHSNDTWIVQKKDINKFMLFSEYEKNRLIKQEVDDWLK